MSAYYPPRAAPRPHSYHPGAAAAPIPVSNAPPGTFSPGIKVQVGNHRVVIVKYLSEGGFAHVYVVQVPNPSGGSEIAVLKRVACADKDALGNMRTEVETMKKLKGHKKIVTYIDSHASQLKGGGYEVFLLMEFCEGGGLIDFMNTRLKDRLKEHEILKIFSDTAEGVACMHYLRPPLLHRDLKVENILISTKDGGRLFKLCDFGSTAPPRPAATNAAEGKLIEEDVQKHTTMQYRSPEMVDVYRKQPIDEKSDIWALGVLLYKLCYYTTPFEAQGQMAILTASYKYPPYPQFSDRLKMLIASMLSENPAKRPNIFQVLKEVCVMRGKEVPIKDIYSKRTQSEARNNQRLPSPEPNIKSRPPVAAVQEIPPRKEQAMPDITPMRRGRPPTTQRTPGTIGNATPVKNSDPFAALDSTDIKVRAAAVDKLASKFPEVDAFGILQTKGGKFDFEPGISQNKETNPETKALADKTFEALAQQEKPAHLTMSRSAPTLAPKPVRKPVPASDKPLPAAPAKLSTSRPGSGTVTPSSISSAAPAIKKPPPISNRPIWRVPSPPNDKSGLSDSSKLGDRKPETLASRTATKHNLHPRPSLQSMRTDSFERGLDIERSRSADVPHTLVKDESMDNSEIEDDQPVVNEVSTLDYLRDAEKEHSHHIHLPHRNHDHNHLSLRRLKHASMPASALSGSRPITAGKLGAAFKRFEAGEHYTEEDEETVPALSPMPTIPLDPSEIAVEDVEEGLSQETRRELERRRLSAEERRVAAAAASYRQQRTQPGGGSRQVPGTTRKVSAIQDRVNNFLAESSRTSTAPRKTAEGYGRYTESESLQREMAAVNDERIVQPGRVTSFEVGDDAAYTQRKSAMPVTAPRISKEPAWVPTSTPRASTSSSAASTSIDASGPARISRNPTVRPSAPPKKAHLRTATSTPQPRDEAIVAPPPQLSEEDLMEFTVVNGEAGDDPAADFARRYPSLSLEMVEAEIGGKGGRARGGPSGLRVRDV